jgi:hypothetical protein
MANLAGVIQQLKREQDRLTREIKGIAAALEAFGAAYGRPTSARKISAAGRERIAAAQRARWAKTRKNGDQAAKVVTMPKRRTMSAAARRKIAAAQRSRSAKVKGVKKSA